MMSTAVSALVWWEAGHKDLDAVQVDFGSNGTQQDRYYVLVGFGCRLALHAP